MRQKITRASIMLSRLAGLLALLLGLLVWLGQGGALLHAHLGTGALLVLALWLLAGLGFGAAPGLALLALAWGFLVPGLGIYQSALLVGDYHWLVQLAHLAIGLGAIGLAEGLAAAMGRRGRPGQPTPVTT